MSPVAASWKYAFGIMMMARSATFFQPTTVSFGDLTLHGRGAPADGLSPVWSGLRFGQIRLVLTRNFIIGLLFMLSFVVATAGVYVADQAAFATQGQPVATVYGGVPLDYD